MKKLSTFCIAFLMYISVFGQAPEKMSYQAVVRDNSDLLVSSQAISMQISILQYSASGTAVFVETHSQSTNANGLVSIEIGAGSVVLGDFATIDWSDGPYFLKTETDLNAGTNYTISGTSELLSTPYALHAKTADSLTSPISENQDLNNVLTIGNDANNGTIVNLNQLTIGSNTTTTDAALDINTTTGALVLPRLNTSQRDLITPVEGMMIYNTDLAKFQGVTPLSGIAVLDQESPTVGSSGVVVTSTIFAAGESFTAGMNGYLEKVEVNVHSVSTSGDFNLVIYSGVGFSGSILSTTSVNISSAGFLEITLDTPVLLSSGQQYTWAIRYVSSGSIALIENIDNYAGGTSITYGGGSAGCCDLAFKTYVSPIGLGWVDLH